MLDDANSTKEPSPHPPQSPPTLKKMSHNPRATAHYTLDDQPQVYRYDDDYLVG